MSEKQSSKTIVGVARTDSVAQAVRKAVELAGGFGFIKPGQTVLVKPNCNSPDPYPGTTNPEVLAEVVRLVWERDPRRVIVGDRSSFMGSTLDFTQRVGIYQAAIEAKAEFMPFDDGPWTPVKPEGAIHWLEGYSIPQIMLEVDHIITVPVTKTHSQATFTMSLKNFVGIIPLYQRRNLLHSDHSEPLFGSRITELNLAVKPSFVVMDGTRAFVSGGPAHGDLVEPNLIIASSDRIACDVTGLAVLKYHGTIDAIAKHSVWEQPQIVRAVELGLGVKSAQEIVLASQGVAEIGELERYVVAQLA